MNLITGFAGCCNGATISIFPGHDSPLNVISLLVNYPQTRKSQMTNLLKIIGDTLDDHIKSKATTICDTSNDNLSDADAKDDPAKLQLAFAVLSSFTPTVFSSVPAVITAMSATRSLLQQNSSLNHCGVAACQSLMKPINSRKNSASLKKRLVAREGSLRQSTLMPAS